MLSHHLATSAASQGLKLSWIDRLIFGRRSDLGLGLLILGITHFFSDPPLARAALAKSIGKILSVFMASDGHHTTNPENPGK
jgi:hypothetical protein